MENGPPTIGFEDGIVDVDQLLVEPQDGHPSVDSVMCFSEKMPEKAMDITEVSCGFGVASTDIALEGGDILNRDVLDSLHTDDDGGYFRLQNDFCGMGEEYLLGVGFSESITDLEYVSSKCLQNSIADGPVLTCADIDSPWKADLFRIMDVPECQDDVVRVKSSKCENTSPHHESAILAEKRPVESSDGNVSKVNDVSSHSFDDIPLDGNDTSLSQPVEMLLCPKNEKSDECGQACQIGDTDRFRGQDALGNLLPCEIQSEALPMLKRSRKPTKRYIDEVADPILRHPKRRREFSSSTFRDKSVGVKDNKKCQVGFKAMKLPSEEAAVKAIQVPFASLVHKECRESPAYNTLTPAYNTVQRLDRRNLTDNPKDNFVASDNPKRRNECSLIVHQTKRNDGVPAANQKKHNNFSVAQWTKNDQCTPTIHSTRRNDGATVSGQRTKQHTAITVRPKKRDECVTAICRKKRENSPIAESPEDVSGRRKHHRLWTVAEVNKLIDGVSDYGVGRWSRIKKVFFSASAHRTSVDLKDKWRNLLKASNLQGQHNQQGERKRNVAWRPLPKAILRRVCELAAMHPYPKEGKPKIAEIQHVSPDRGTDITLSDYRRILRSINGN